MRTVDRPENSQRRSSLPRRLQSQMPRRTRSRYGRRCGHGVGRGPVNCRVEGVMDQRTGSDGNPYAIGFCDRLAGSLERWFLFQGGGGLNSAIRPPLGPRATGEFRRWREALPSFQPIVGAGRNLRCVLRGKDQEAAINFASASVGKVTMAAKAIIAGYYGQPVKRSYFAGCSTGGHEHAGSHAPFVRVRRRHPGGRADHAHRHSNLALAWGNAPFNEIAPWGDAGKPDPARFSHRATASW